jgi:DNA-binding transcriptional ArsR family regulator
VEGEATPVRDLNRVFAALADPTRRAIIRLVGEQPLRSGELAAQLAISRPTMSRHLRVLRRAGIVEETPLEGDARGRLYQLRTELLSVAGAWLAEVAALRSADPARTPRSG